MYKTIISSDINIVYKNVAELLSFIKLGLNSISDCDLFDVKVILNELIINAIKHGNNSDKTKKVIVSAFLGRNNEIVIIIEDEGHGWCCKIDNDCEYFDDIYDVKENGRGLFIVRNLCDVVKINSIGNKVVILKKLKAMEF